MLRTFYLREKCVLSANTHRHFDKVATMRLLLGLTADFQGGPISGGVTTAPSEVQEKGAGENPRHRDSKRHHLPSPPKTQEPFQNLY